MTRDELRKRIDTTQQEVESMQRLEDVLAAIGEVEQSKQKSFTVRISADSTLAFISNLPREFMLAHLRAMQLDLEAQLVTETA